MLSRSDSPVVAVVGGRCSGRDGVHSVARFLDRQGERRAQRHIGGVSIGGMLSVGVRRGGNSAGAEGWVALCGVLHTHQAHVGGNAVQVAAIQSHDDGQSAIQSTRALLHAHDELLLALLVEVELVVVAHAHSHQPFPQLITGAEREKSKKHVN